MLVLVVADVVVVVVVLKSEEFRLDPHAARHTAKDTTAKSLYDTSPSEGGILGSFFDLGQLAARDVRAGIPQIGWVLANL